MLEPDAELERLKKICLQYVPWYASRAQAEHQAAIMAERIIAAREKQSSENVEAGK